MILVYNKMRPGLFIREQFKSPYTRATQLNRLTKYWLQGYSSEQIALLDVADSNKLYLKDFFKYHITNNTNLNVWPILHDKLFFHLHMAGHLPVVPLLFAVVNGKVHAIDQTFSRKDFLEELQQGQSFVIKPLQGGGGKGLYFIESDSQGLKINKKASSVDQIDSLLNTLPYHGLYHHVSQHSELATIFPDTANTLRLLTCVDRTGAPHLIAGRLRIGSKASYPTDNFQQGGLVGKIEPTSGEVIEVFSHNNTSGKISQPCHPDNGHQIIGLTIPLWREICAHFLNFLKDFPAFDLVGWDILVTENDFVVLEGNHNPGMFSIFMFDDLNHLPIFKEFCRHKALI